MPPKIPTMASGAATAIDSCMLDPTVEITSLCVGQIISSESQSNYGSTSQTEWRHVFLLLFGLVTMCSLCGLILYVCCRKKMFQSNSKGAKTGKNWTSMIYFDPAANEPKEDIHSLTDEELMTTIFTDLVGVNEVIIKVSSYKSPLKPWQWTMAMFYHMFIVFKTASWYWSIEKNSEGITIQRSKEEFYVKDKYRQKKRFKHEPIMQSNQGRKSVYDLVKWLYTKNELNKEYNYLFSNCQHFAKAVFKQLDVIIYFDPEADNHTEDKLPSLIEEKLMITLLSGLVGVNEDIIKVYSYKSPLMSWQWTMAIFYHMFIILETESWYWSIEKKSEGITIQRSEKERYVKDKYRQKDRLHMTMMRSHEGRQSVWGLVKWLCNKNEFNEEYNYRFSNCKHFANTVFNQATQRGKMFDRVIYFNPIADKSRDNTPHLTYEELLTKVDRIVDVHENILEVSMYKSPLIFDDSLALPFLNGSIVYETFIVFKTESFYWSMQHTILNETIFERSKNKSNVEEKYRRNCGVELVQSDEGMGSVFDFIKWLDLESESNQISPSQFSNAAFNHVAKNKSL